MYRNVTDVSRSKNARLVCGAKPARLISSPATSSTSA